ncbi:hypothetical protein ADK66_00335 [Micromonospora sp. NRRL B-16802]|nr:hypothetical protein ADK66_00335 [Micromonospora sp. NRRL B-16802]
MAALLVAALPVRARGAATSGWGCSVAVSGAAVVAFFDAALLRGLAARLVGVAALAGVVALVGVAALPGAARLAGAVLLVEVSCSARLAWAACSL